MILDDFEKIKQVDKSNMLSFCVDAPKHYGKAVELARKMKVSCPDGTGMPEIASMTLYIVPDV